MRKQASNLKRRLLLSKKRIKKGWFILTPIILAAMLAYYFFMPVLEVVYTGNGRDIVMKGNLKGKQIYRLNTERLRGEILKDKRIENVRLFRFPWGMVVIHTCLRTPVAVYIERGEKYGVDRNGVVFQWEGVDTLPEIKGNKSYINLAVSLIRILKDVDRVYITEDGPVTRMKGYRILWGRSEYREKARKTELLIKSGLPSGEFDLRFGDLIIYREEVKGGKG